MASDKEQQATARLINRAPKEMRDRTKSLTAARTHADVARMAAEVISRSPSTWTVDDCALVISAAMHAFGWTEGKTASAVAKLAQSAMNHGMSEEAAIERGIMIAGSIASASTYAVYEAIKRLTEIAPEMLSVDQQWQGVFGVWLASVSVASGREKQEG